MIGKQALVPDTIVRWGLLLFAACVSITMSGQAAAVIVVLAGWMLGVLFYYKKFIWNRPSLKWHELVLLGFFGMLMLSTVFSRDRTASTLRLGFIAGDIALYFAVVGYVWDRKNIQAVINVLVVCAVIESLYGFVQYFTGISFLNAGPHKHEIAPYFRVFGTWDHFNSLGGILGMIIPVSLFSGIYSAKRGQKYFYLGSTVIITLCLLLTRTRGACLGVIAALLVLGIMSRRMIVVAVILVFTAGVFIYPGTRNRLVNAFRNPADMYRLRLWRDAAGIIKDKPLTGTGLSTFKGSFIKDPLDRSYPGEKLVYHHAHNIYLGLAAETGVIGALLLCVFVGGVIIGFIRNMHTISDVVLKGAGLGLCGAVIDFMVHGMVDYTFAGNTTYLFWFACAVMTAVWSSGQRVEA